MILKVTNYKKKLRKNEWEEDVKSRSWENSLESCLMFSSTCERIKLQAAASESEQQRNKLRWEAKGAATTLLEVNGCGHFAIKIFYFFGEISHFNDDEMLNLWPLLIFVRREFRRPRISDDDV